MNLENNYLFPYKCNFRPIHSKPILPDIGFEKGLNSYEIKVFRQLREKYDLSLESNENAKEEENELSDEAKVTLERIKKGEVFTL